MIKTFLHRGLQRFFETGKANRLPVTGKARIARVANILAQLDLAQHPRDVDMPGWRLHELKPGRPGVWSVEVTGNYRITFRFEDTDAIDVDIEDYH